MVRMGPTTSTTSEGIVDRHGLASIRCQLVPASTSPFLKSSWCGHRWRLKTHIGGCEIMKTRETTLKSERDQLYSRVACATGAQVLEDETDDDHPLRRTKIS
ncbi:hypothetical protein U9M48_027639 [Paspalum notatum var. saurae]|uniref:Uncharacterized protein n=1 Tax=Paspalum notatum var. saurae TaxID=547442 RepID=A0AAQ3X0B7_PASNO